MFGSLILLILADVNEMETVLEKVEWATLLFFAGLFILMEVKFHTVLFSVLCKLFQVLAELGLIKFIGDRTVDLINVSYLII